MTDRNGLELADYLEAGDGVWWTQTGAEPTPLVDALLDQVDAIGPVTAFVGMTFHHRLTHDADSPCPQCQEPA